jgi:probable F420-dependent oxidoreductase
VAPPKLGILPFFERGQITDPVWVREFVQMAEAEGCESLWAVEHVLVAKDYEKLYPYSESGEMPAGPTTVMPDPLEWLSFAAGVSERITLATGVFVLAQHSAAVVAKRAATLDALSGGRFLLGVGIGWQKEEYEAIGVPYRDRARRLEENIAAMRALWQPDYASFSGKYVSFENVMCDVKPARAGGVPIVIGGSSPMAAKRAGRIGNGWYPYVISPEDYAARVAELREAAREAGRDPDEIELTVWPASFDFTRGFDLDFVRSYVESGVDRLMLSAPESGGATIEDARQLIRNYSDQILAKL